MSEALVGRHFTLSRVVQRSGGVFLRFFSVFLLVLIVVGGAELYGYALVVELDPSPYWAHGGESSWPRFLARLAGETIGFSVLDSLASAVLLAAALGVQSGEAAPFGVILRRGLGAWPRLIPVGILGTLSWSVLYWQTDFVPGLVGLVANLVIMTALWVYGSVVVAERAGVWGGVRRSLFLVSGNVWRIAVLVVLYIFVFFGALYCTATLLPGGFTARFEWEYGGAISAAYAVNLIIAQTISAVAAVSYILLRNDKDGVPVAEIAPVFD